MKKKFLLLATLVVAMAVTVITFSKNNSAKAEYNNKSDELISYKITIPSDYYSSRNVSEVVLHYGVNGWNNANDTTMYVTTGPTQYGIPTSYTYNAIIKVHKGDTINYCYKTTYKNDETKWNNNNGKDFHVVANESNVKEIQYEVDWLAENSDLDVSGDVTLHYGVNGWDNAKDVKMEIKTKSEYNGQTETWYKAIITVEEGSTINYCVKANTTEGEKWDNNNGENYSVIANQNYYNY